MDQDKRKGAKPLPDNFQDYLSAAQLSGLSSIERYGWHLTFIRRPLFQKAIAVVVNQEGTSLGILEEDGRLNLDPDIDLRDQ